ncbi:MAG: PilT/PilU family type 4a pilus ATPase [Bdellovibrionales bacterium]|nr:PilT/PilU family type 4a pilus ATPase [Bdellovibrionales bacterium]
MADLQPESIWNYLEKMHSMHASDLIISVGNPIKVRIRGLLKSLETPSLSEKLVYEMIKVLLSPEQMKTLEEDWDLDLSLHRKGVGRFRTNVLKQRLGYMAVFRFIPDSIPDPDSLGLDKVIKDLMDNHQGLVLVTGPIRSGKTTTMASLVNMINQKEKSHIITIEDPIEYIYPAGQSMINQREVRKHTMSTAAAMRAALREDPDVILVGEMRDLETMELAIGAAETGHLVLSTLQTKSAAKTIDRVVDAFPPKQVEQIRTLLSGSLKGIISQKLIPSADGKSMIMASEVLLANISLTKMIKEGKTFQIASVMQMGRAHGMRTLDHSILGLVKEKRITPVTGLKYANNPKALSEEYTTQGIEM